jgi:hypothetical protein
LLSRINLALEAAWAWDLQFPFYELQDFVLRQMSAIFLICDACGDGIIA